MFGILIGLSLGLIASFGTSALAGSLGLGVEWVYYLSPVIYLLSGGHKSEMVYMYNFACRHGMMTAVVFGFVKFIIICGTLGTVSLPAYYLFKWLV